MIPFRQTIKQACIALVAVAPTFAFATSVPRVPPEAAKNAAIVFLGENHDNAEHHAIQAEWVSALQPRALVFEMLTSEQALRATPEARSTEDNLQSALEWEASGWPDFSMYYPIFEAVPNAAIYGAAVPRERVRGLMDRSLADVGGVAYARFGLSQDLSPEQQSDREDLQRAAHCDALPEEMLPMMVNVQRLRDAALAHTALEALQATGGPVVVITGNGHAREDWGAPYLVRQVAEELAVFSLGQGEAGQAPPGGFGLVVDGPSVDRGDPCDAFK